MKTSILLYVSLAFFSAGMLAQDIKPTDVVSINPIAKVKIIKNGIEADINFVLSIKKTWHINANKPNDQSLTPTVINIDSSSAYKVINITYPPPEMVKLQFSDNELALYEQEAVINVKAEINKNFNKKSLTVAGQLQYQPCNNLTCLFPVSKPFSFSIKLK